MYNLLDCRLCNMPVLGFQEGFAGMVFFSDHFLVFHKISWGTAQYTLASAPDCIPCLMLSIGNAGLGYWCRIVQNVMKVIAQEWYPCSCLLEGMLNSVHRCVFICTNTRLSHCFQLTEWSRFISASFSHTFTYPLFSWVAMVACPSEKLLAALHLWSSEVLFVTQELWSTVKT